MKTLVGALGVVAVFAVIIGWKVYAYDDCRHVGHAWFYCVMKTGD